MKASLTNFQQSPRKVRLVADLLRGKEISRARTLLAFAEKKSAQPLAKLLDSAVANARASGARVDELIVREIFVNQGISIKRFMPMARGRANPYRHRRSTVVMVLGEKKAAARSANSAVAVAAPSEAPKKKASAKKRVSKK